MRRNLRVGLVAAMGIAALAAVALYQSRVRQRRAEGLYVAALDGAVGQPRRFLLPRLRLRFFPRRRGSA